MSWETVKAITYLVNITVAFILAIASVLKFNRDPMTAIWLMATAIFISI